MSQVDLSLVASEFSFKLSSRKGEHLWVKYQSVQTRIKAQNRFNGQTQTVVLCLCSCELQTLKQVRSLRCAKEQNSIIHFRRQFFLNESP